jgi:hypothetical protein
LPLAEPMTVATDWGLAAFALVLGFRLMRGKPVLSQSLVAASFWSLAASALLGGAVHGFAPHLDLPSKQQLWRFIYGGIGLANLLLLGGIVVAIVPKRFRAMVLLLLAARFAFVLLLGWGRDFAFVMGDIALTLLLLLGLALFFTLVHPRPFAPWLLLGVVVSFGGALVQTGRLAPHPHFNHNDLFHVVQMLGLYLFYRAARALPFEA